MHDQMDILMTCSWR